MDKGTYVFINTRFIGFHKWAAAPDPVKYLRDVHRHEFHVKVTVKVWHVDRDVEFITLKKSIDEFLKCNTGDWPVTWSCERMCHEILANFKDRVEIQSVEVSEDGENGAIVVCQ